jgi:hypothetical protein
VRVSPSSRLVIAVLFVTVVILAAVGLRQPSSAATAALASRSPSAELAADGASSGTDLQTSASAAIAPPDASAKPQGTPRPTPRATPKATAATCRPTDQDRYVYNPSRLEVLARCVRITGVVQAVRHEADGDLHILVKPDPAYRHLLTPANQGEELGDLVVEPVCVRSVSQSDAKQTCASDPDPLAGPLPTVGDHVWMEGRYVLDLEHGSWAELHPLYRWGRQ